MKEIVGKTKTKTRNLLRRITIGEKEIFDKKTITNQFNSINFLKYEGNNRNNRNHR